MGAGVSKRFSNLPLLRVTAGDAQKNSTIQGCHMDQWGFWHPQNKNTYTQGWPEIVTEGHALPERVAADAGTGSHVLASIIFQQYKSWWLPWNFNFFFIFPASFSAKCFPSLYTGAWALPTILSNLSVSPAISLLSAQMAAFEECSNFISPAVCSR